MSISGLAYFAAVYFVFVITPGPAVAAIIARGLGSGTRGALPYSLGFMLGDMVWFTCAAAGLSALATQYNFAFLAVKYCGCGYLIYLAWKMWWAPVAAGDIEARNVETDAWPSFIGALTLCLGNPKVIVFFMSLMPLVIDVEQLSLTTYFILILIMVPFGPALTFSLLYMAKKARVLFQSATALQRINRASALLMAGAALAIAIKG